MVKELLADYVKEKKLREPKELAQTLKTFYVEVRKKEFVQCIIKREFNKNRRKAIFNWAAKALFFLRGGGGYTHSGYHKTLSATIACDRTSCETET